MLVLASDEEPAVKIPHFNPAFSQSLTRCTQTYSLSHQNGLFPNLFLIINWFLSLIHICFEVTGTHFVLQNAFILSISVISNVNLNFKH